MSVIVYRAEMGFSHAELLQCLPAAVAPYTINRLDENDSTSFVLSLSLSGEGRVAHLHLESEKTREIASIKLPVTVITIEFENFSETHYREFINRFKKYLQRGGG